LAGYIKKVMGRFWQNFLGIWLPGDRL